MSSVGAYNYLLSKKLFLNKEMVDTINNLKSKFVCISKKYPRCVITNKYLFLL